MEWAGLDHAHNLRSKRNVKVLMGCVSSKTCLYQDPKKQKPKRKNMFVVQGIIGTGGFGKVLAVSLQHTGKWYAVKEVNKVDLLKHKSGHSMIFSELEAMSRVGQHPFLVALHLAYHDRRNCYLVLDLKTGGDLRYYLRQKMIFEERDVAFYVACISSALNHIHSRNMLHRDIKPENIILDDRGWPHLADFGVAHVHTAENSAKFNGTLTSTLASGTKQYLAPEVFCRAHIHGPESDFWALAVVAYELLYARRPYEKHCSISFIHYLENALTVKRERVKAARMQDLKCGRGLSLSSELSECCGFSPARSPRSIAASYSPPVSASTSRESSAYFPGITASRSCSIDEADGYCSSAHASPAHGYNLRKSASGFVTPVHSAPTSRASSRASTRSVDTDHSPPETPRGSEGLKKLPGRLDLAIHLPNSPLRTPRRSMFSHGIGFEDTEAAKCGEHLPRLGAPFSDSAPHSPPHSHSPAHRVSHTNHTSHTKQTLLQPLPGVAVGSPAHLSHLLQQQAYLHSQFSCYEKDPAVAMQRDQHFQNGGTKSFVSVDYGDHWAVDDDFTLPSDLRVPIPQCSWAGPVTNECLSFLKGMFDIRPSHRLSSRDIEAVRTHSWLQMHNVENWTDLHNHRFTPNFKPGKRFMHENFADPANAMLGGQGNFLSDPDAPCGDIYRNIPLHKHDLPPDDSADGTGGVLSAEQRASFRGFRYTADGFRGMFRNEEPEPDRCSERLKTCSSTSSTATYVQY